MIFFPFYSLIIVFFINIYLRLIIFSANLSLFYNILVEGIHNFGAGWNPYVVKASSVNNVEDDENQQ